MGESNQQQKKQKTKKKKRVNKKLLILSLLTTFILAFVVIAGFMVVVLAGNYEIDESKLQMREATTIYDRNEKEAAKLFVENREYIPKEKIPPLVKEAFIAVEDQRFYQHSGIDLQSIGRAIYRDVLARSMVEGGSTITQQLAKNVFLTNEKKLMRKTEEALIAIKLEQMYEKDEILEMYLNYINFGEGAYGIDSAAKIYFDKEVDELETHEIAILASLPKAPNSYSPFKERNAERSEERKKVVLKIMEDQGLITAEQRKEYADKPVKLSTKSISNNPALLTYIDMVIEEAEEKYGISRDEILTGGYKINTALDLTAQEAMYEAMSIESPVSKELFPQDSEDQIVQGSMVIMDHQSGSIVAVMGGRDYVRRGLNRATSDARQPGSTFKPIVTYAPALESQWHPYDLLKDERINYGGYKPRNYDGKYRGQATMMEAVQWSYNAPAVWLLNEIGIKKGMNYAQAFGFKDVKRELGIALGDVGASPLQMANAFGSFANSGMMMDPYLIEEIKDRTGQSIAKKEQGYQQVITPQTAWYMTKMLEKVVEDGTGKRAKLRHPVAGKTGTTQAAGKGQSGVRDAWFVGYTPQYSAAVWMGFDHSKDTMQTSGGNHPAKVFNYVMEKALANEPVTSFKKPEGVEELQPPVQLDKINDVSAFVTLYQNLSLSVDLEFTPHADDRTGYNIYRLENGSSDRILLAEKVTKDQLINGKGWQDKEVSLLNTYQYVVEPVNLMTNEVGEPSNSITVDVNPSAPYFRREGDFMKEDYDQWLNDLVDQYNEEDGEVDGEGVDGEGDGVGEEESEGNLDEDTEEGTNGNPPEHSNSNSKKVKSQNSGSDSGESNSP